MKKSLKKRMLLLIFSFVILLNILSILMNYQNFVSTMEQANYSTASTVAETCALIIDGDALEGYIKTGRRDNAYYVTWNKLLDYKNTNKDIVYLSVVWFDEEGGHYIFDTDLTQRGAFLGDKVAFDFKQAFHKEGLMQGRERLFLTYANRMDLYRPVLSSYNIPMGYVIVGISTEQAEKEQIRYLIKLVLAVSALSLVVTIFFVYTIDRSILRPINQLSAAVSSYVNSAGEPGKDSPLSHLSIHTGDEIENLFHSVKKMESDILDSSNNLAVAMWNSQHDSMTQLYNKRYLADCTEEYESLEAVGIVYFDVDNLKKMNDICGHEGGDDVIKKTADFVRKYQTKQGAGFRMGGDEFMLLVGNVTEEEMAERVRQMKADPQTRLTPPESKVQCRIAIGYAFQKGNIHLDSLITKADQNMYLDKQSHR
jgi:diguanylate cyclase (GGDEF)-like protein